MKLGVSVYPDLSPLEDIRSYLEQASSCGFTRVFSSMFSYAGGPMKKSSIISKSS